MSIATSIITAYETPEDPDSMSEQWRAENDTLVMWAIERFIVRDDAYAAYKEGGIVQKKTTLSHEVLARHFLGHQTVAAYLIARDSVQSVRGWNETLAPAVPTATFVSVVLALDIDRHSDDVDASRNFETALAILAKIHSLGMHALLIDSDGQGGFHILMLWDKPEETEILRRFGLWLVAPHASLDIEVFPKQYGLEPKKPYGNPLRIPGKHPRRDHWSKVWSPNGEWMEGYEAIMALIDVPGNQAIHIPSEVRQWTPPVKPSLAAVTPDPVDPWLGPPATSSPVANYVETAFQGELATIRSAPKTRSNDVLNTASLKIGSLVGPHLDEQRALTAIRAAAEERRPGQKDTEGTIRSGFTGGLASPRDLSSKGQGSNRRQKPDPSYASYASYASNASDASDASKYSLDPSLPPTNESLGLTCFANVEPEEVEWLVPNKIPRGLNLVVGVGGMGKTYGLLSVAAYESIGRPWPGQPDVWRTPGKVLIASAEDELASTLVPRFIAQGGDRSMMFALGMARDSKGREEPFTIQSIDRLRSIMLLHQDITTIIIDPISSFLGGRVNENSNAELRAVLRPLSEFAGEHKVTILAITHFGKGASTSATRKILGSVAYGNAARSVWCLMADPDSPKRRLFLPAKANLSVDPKGLAFQIDDGVVVWEPNEIDDGADDVLAREASSPAKDGKDDKAKVWLVQFMNSKGGTVSGKTVESEAKNAGFGRELVWKIKKELAMRSQKQKFGGGWAWILPDELRSSEAFEAFEASEAYEASEASGQSMAKPKTTESFPAPKPIPASYKPIFCTRCSMRTEGWYHAYWNGDTPACECQSCHEKLSG